jgi:hypothetical protein
MSDPLNTVPYGQATLPINSQNGFNWDSSGRLITITLDSAALPLQAQNGHTFDANGALLINTTVPPAYVQSALSQAIGVVSRLGGRMYAAPAGFDPYAFLNSDGSGGVSNTAGQLVGAALDLSGGMGYAGPELTTNGAFSSNTTGWDIRAATSGTISWTPGTLRFESPPSGLSLGAAQLVTGLIIGQPYLLSGRCRYVSGPGAARIQLRDANGGGGSDLFVPPVVTSPTFIETSAIWVATQTTAWVTLLSSPGATISEFQNISLRAVSSSLANAATQATTANKPIIAAGPTSLFNAFAYEGINSRLATANIAGSANETFVISLRPTVSLGAVAKEIATHWSSTGLLGDILVRTSAGEQFQMLYHDGTTFRSATGTALPVGQYSVLTAIKATSRCYVRQNGVETGSVAFGGGVQVAAVPVAFGSGFAAAPLVAQYAFKVWLPAEPTAAELAILERAAGICAGTVTS